MSSKLQGVTTAGSAPTIPVYGRGGGRHGGGVTLIQASAWNVGTCRLDVKGAIQVEPPQESEYRCEAQGRTERSSDEAPVMGVERRPPGHPAFKSGQP